MWCLELSNAHNHSISAAFAHFPDKTGIMTAVAFLAPERTDTEVLDQSGSGVMSQKESTLGHDERFFGV